MLKLIINQANWGIFGSVFGFLIGFLIKIYLIDIVGLDAWGKYVAAHSFASFSNTILSLGIPWIILKYMPNYIEKNISDAKQFMRIILHYAILVSCVFLFFMWFLAPWLDNYIYKDIEGFYLILLIVSIHAPISILTGIITSLYRSIFKVKEIIIYGTFVTVPLRAILTYFIFTYTNNIIYFIFIELFTTFLTVAILFYFFNKNEVSFIGVKKEKSYKIDKDVIDYGKRMYANSLVSFFAAQSLSLIISIKLSPEQIGIYSILLTVTGVTMFIIRNLNNIFAPAITKLYKENKISELSSLYKQTTFMVNLFTMPFIIIIILFASDILYLYDDSGMLSRYTIYLYIIMCARIILLLTGSSGTFMLMAGLEKQELILQVIKAILMSFSAIIFIGHYGLIAMVILFVFFTLFLNIAQLIFIYRNIGITPFSNNLYLLIIISLPVIYFSISYTFDFTLLHYILLPFFIYCLYFIFFIKRLKSIYLNLSQDV